MTMLIGHRAVAREFAALARSSEPPHAILLAGPIGIGRTALALEYARLLNCEAAGAAGFGGFGDTPALPCGACRPCRLIAEGRHPDVVVVGPGDMLCRPRPGESSHERHPGSRDIRICQVRGIIEAVSRYPLEARYRVIIVEPADRLGRDAANTLLKTLEEPPAHTVFVLVTAAPEAILETVLSRCRRIDVRPVPRDEIEAGLIARGIEPGLAGRAAAEARGRPVIAIDFAANPDEMAVRTRLLARCARIAAEPRVAGRLSYAEELSERWRRDRATVAAELDAWESYWEQRLVEAAAEDPDQALEAVAALRAITRTREDLLAQVLARPVFELMLLDFPRVTLATPSPEEAPAANA